VKSSYPKLLKAGMGKRTRGRSHSKRQSLGASEVRATEPQRSEHRNRSNTHSLRTTVGPKYKGQTKRLDVTDQRSNDSKRQGRPNSDKRTRLSVKENHLWQLRMAEMMRSRSPFVMAVPEGRHRPRSNKSSATSLPTKLALYLTLPFLVFPAGFNLKILVTYPPR
jgi:hypothetical protein